MTSSTGEYDPTLSELHSNVLQKGAILANENEENENKNDTPLTCENCEAPRETGETVCQNCGYYHLIGKVVGTNEKSAEELLSGDDAEAAKEPFNPMYLAYILTGIIVAVGLISLLGLYFTESESEARSIWSMRQLSIGFLMMAAAHMACFAVTMKSDGDTSLLDFVLRPLGIWIPMVEKLPKSLPYFGVFTAGLTAVLCAVFITGNVPFHKLWSTENEEENDLVAAVADQERANSGEIGPAETLDEIIEQDQKTIEEMKAEDPDREYLDTLIVGFTPITLQTDLEDPDSVEIVGIESVTLAANMKGKLTVIGTVSDIPERYRQRVHKELVKVMTPRPFLPAVPSKSKKWVKPKWPCRASYLPTEDGDISELTFHWLQKKIKLPTAD